MKRALSLIGVLASLACGGRMDAGSDDDAEAGGAETMNPTDGYARGTIDQAGQQTPPEDTPPSGDATSSAYPVDEQSMVYTSEPEPDGSQDECGYPMYPPTDGPSGDWLPYTLDDPFALVADVQSTMVGTWRGLVQTPWTTPYEVELTFSADGRYSSRCSELPASCCVAFYYGTDEDTPLKQFRLDGVTLTGEVIGEIDIAFDYGDSYGLPAWQGELSGVARDASGNRLRFAFQTNSGYGPLEFDLERMTHDDAGGLPIR